MIAPTDKRKIFIASCIALVATSMTFAIRSNSITILSQNFHLTAEEIGYVQGTAFWGFTLSMIIGGPLCDILGIKKLIYIAFVGHIAGIVLTVLSTGFSSLFVSTLLVGIANGMVEAACNPLIATLYAGQKTEKLNQFHMWFPGGIVIGGVIAYVFDAWHLSWQWHLISILIPVIIYGILFFPLTLPVTERVSKGISTAQMFKACLNLLFPLMVFCMLLTSVTELGTNQWIVELLSAVGVPSILLLVFISGLMALGRWNAGIIEHRLSPPGMLLFSSVFSTIGLLLLSVSSGYFSFLAAAVFAVGICFFWPTMLGFVSTYLPKTGSLGLAIMGGAGMLSVALILPVIGKVYDINTHEAMKQFNALSVQNSVAQAKLTAGAVTLRYVAVLPAFLSIVFSFLVLKRNKLVSEINN